MIAAADLDIGNLAQGKAKSLRLLDKAQQGDQIGGIVAIAVRAAITRRDDAFALVKADARGGHAGSFRNFSDFHGSGP